MTMASSGAAGEIKYGFNVGLGVALALAVWAALQILIGRAVHRG
jgi:hypothetical protein